MSALTTTGPLNLFPVQPPESGVLNVVRTYRRRMPLFLMVFVVIFALVAAYTFTQTPKYTAQTSVVIAPRKAEVGSDRSDALNDPTADASIDTQVEVLRSPALAAAVVDRLGLAREPMFSRLTSSHGMLASFRLPGQSSAPLTSEQRRRAAIETLVSHLDVHRVAQTFLIELDFTNDDRNFAALVANAFGQVYIDRQMGLKLTSARSGDHLLAEQLERARTELTAANAAVGAYRISHNLMSVGGATLSEQQLTNLDEQVATARAHEAEADARLGAATGQLEHGSNGEDVGEALGSPVIQQLRSQRAEVTRHLAELSDRYDDKYPAISTAKQQLADVDAQIHAEVGRIVSNLKAQRDVAARGASSLTASLNTARGGVAANNTAGVKLSDLELRANAARALYEELLGRVREIGAQTATTQPDAQIESLALAPLRPSAPNWLINLLVGVLLGVAGGIGAVVLRQGLDQGLSSLDDVEARLRLPYLAGLPTLASSVKRPRRSDPLDAVVAHRESAYAEGFRTLGAAVLASGGGMPVRSIVLTSALPNEGKTTAAICLARILAMSGRRVVLVDADLRRASVAAALNLPIAFGLHEVIAGEASLADALMRDEASGALVLGIRPGSYADTSLMDDPRFDRLLTELKARCDIIVFDASPVLPVVDGRLLARKVDAVVLLARWRKTPEAAVEMAMHQLRGVGAVPVGVALSRVNLNAMARSGDGDPARYLNTYKNYYHS